MAEIEGDKEWGTVPGLGAEMEESGVFLDVYRLDLRGSETFMRHLLYFRSHEIQQTRKAMPHPSGALGWDKERMI